SLVGDDAAGREEDGDVDLAALQGLDRHRPGVEGCERTREVDPIDPLQPRDAERVGFAVGWAAERQLAFEPGQVGDRLEPVGFGGLGRDDEGVGVHRRRRGVSHEVQFGEVALEELGGLGGVTGRLPLLLVQVLEHRRRVLGREVDVARLERPQDDVPESAERLDRDLVAVRLERLGVDLRQDRALSEVLGTDRDRRALLCVTTRPAGSQRECQQSRPDDAPAEPWPHGYLPSVVVVGGSPSDRHRCGKVAANRNDAYPIHTEAVLWRISPRSRWPVPVGSTSGSVHEKTRSAPTARRATAAPPTNTYTSFPWAKPSITYRPRPPHPTTAPSVAVATTCTADTRMDVQITGMASGSSV